jgi:hypothetical protein
MARARLWEHQLEASKHEALLAVDLYNRPGMDRRVEAFIVHMHIAWLNLCQARLRREGVDFWYRDEAGKKVRDANGEPRSWELTRCLRHLLPEDDPSRLNLEFFIGPRNKVEHHWERIIGDAIAGKSQALIMNYEVALVDWFGADEGLANALRFPVFLSSLTEEAVTALKQTYARLPKRVTHYIESYDEQRDTATRIDYRYDFRVLLIQQTAPKTQADVAMRFVRLDELPDRQREQLQVVDTIVRDKHVPVEHMNEYRRNEVVELVQERLGLRFTTNDHTIAWKHYKIRPPRGAAHQERTDPRYCVWDRAHGDHLYTDAWINRLVKGLADPKQHRKVLGHDPQPIES